MLFFPPVKSMRLGRAGGRTYAAAAASSHSSAMDRSVVTSNMITIEFPSMMIKQASAKHPLSASRFLLVFLFFFLYFAVENRAVLSCKNIPREIVFRAFLYNNNTEKDATVNPPTHPASLLYYKSLLSDLPTFVELVGVFVSLWVCVPRAAAA